MLTLTGFFGLQKWQDLKKMPATDRERLLKRVLPAFAILVLYFTFVSGKMSAAVAAAQASIHALQISGMVPSTVPGLASQASALAGEIRKLEAERAAMDAEMSKATEFLRNPDYTNQVSARLATVLEKHHVLVLEDKVDAASAKDNMPKSLRDIRDWVSGRHGGIGASARHQHLQGGYADMYRALDELSRDALTIVPITLEMNVPEGGGELQWTLDIWI